MSFRAAAVLLVAAVLLLSAVVWRSQLFTVQRPGDTPHPLAVREPVIREAATLDVVLPAVPTGMRRLRADAGVLLVHYWAPWERHSRLQATGLDSLTRLPGLESLEVVVVCFDPFPSVARYVARHRLRLAVLLDIRHELRGSLPCPSIPYTYVVDRRGHIAVAQEGEVDWLAPATIEALRGLAEEPPGIEAPALHRPAPPGPPPAAGTASGVGPASARTDLPRS